MAKLTDERERTEVLERMLCVLASAWGREELRVPVSGVWNERTAEAVRLFQEMECLPVTGICDRRTWEAAVSACTEAEEACAPVYIRIPADCMTEEDRKGRERDAPQDLVPREHAPGDHAPRDAVAQLQLILRGLSERYPLGTVPLDGELGAATEGAVRAFQRIACLPQTGRADRATWRALAAAYNNLEEG